MKQQGRLVPICLWWHLLAPSIWGKTIYSYELEHLGGDKTKLGMLQGSRVCWSVWTQPNSQGCLRRFAGLEGSPGCDKPQGRHCTRSLFKIAQKPTGQTRSVSWVLLVCLEKDRHRLWLPEAAGAPCEAPASC